MIDILLTQKRLLYIADTVCRILERHSVPHIITYGTLLGAIRHKGFIPWDDDFDLYLFDESYDSAISYLRSELPNDLFLEDEISEPLYFHGWAHVKDLRSEAISEQFPQDNLYAHHGLSLDLYKASLIPREQLILYQLEERLKYFIRKNKHGFMSDDEFAYQKTILEKQIKLEKQKSISHPEDLIYGFMSLDGDYLDPAEVFPITKYEFEGHLFNGPNRYHDFLTRCYGDYLQLPSIEKRMPHYSKVTLYRR